MPPVSAVLDLAAEDTYDPAWDDTRYLNQNNWYQNTYWVVENGDEQNHRVNDAVTVWYAGFSEFRQASMAGMADRLVPGDAHVDSVRMSHSVGGASVGTKYDVPEGDGTDACSGGAPRLQDVFPDAEPGTLADYNADDNAYPAAHDYMPCGWEDATHLAVKWTINGFPGPDVGLVAKGTYNWDAVHGLHPDLLVRDGNGQLFSQPVPTDALYGHVDTDVTYYRAVMPDAPKPGHDRAILEIEPEFGYYVSDVVVTCCFRGNAYEHCSVYNTGHVFHKAFDVQRDGGVSLELDSESFCHGSGGTQPGATSRYYIMIRTAPIGDELLVEYDPGEMDLGRDSGWLSMDRGNPQAVARLDDVSDQVGGEGHVWRPGDLDYKIDCIRADVLQELERDGWRFAGWELEYYEAAEKEYGGGAAGKARMARAADGAAGDFVGIRFEGDRWNEMLVDPGDEVSLKMHARLVALWERSDVSELPKTGGDGTAACVVAGVALIAIAGVGAIWYAVRKKDGGGDPRGRDA